MRTLTSQELRQLSHPAPWRACAALALDWALILLALIGGWAVASWWAWGLTIVAIAGRQHALLVLMHEAAHGRLFRNSLGNELVGALLCGCPLGVNMRAYRAVHLRHHRFVNTEADPEWKEMEHQHRWPRGSSRLAFLASVLTYSIRSWRDVPRTAHRYQKAPGGPAWARAAWAATRVIVPTGILAGLAGMTSWNAVVLGWLLPLTIVLPLCLRIRGLAEHMSPTYPHQTSGTRNIICPAWERWLFAPHHYYLHHIHHQYPSIPSSRLPGAFALMYSAAEREIWRRADSSYLRLPRVLPRSLIQADVTGKAPPKGAPCAACSTLVSSHA